MLFRSEGKTADLVKFLERRGRTRTIEGFAGTIEGRREDRPPPVRRRRRRTPTRTASARSAPNQEMVGGFDISDILAMKEDEDKITKWQREQVEKAAKLREADLEARRAATEARLEQERQLAEAQQRAIELERTRRDRKSVV